MKIELDFRSRTPLSTQLVEQIRVAITAGALQTGSRLPPARQLAEELGINFSTVSRAYRQLDGEGLLSTQRGRGTYIQDSGNWVSAVPYQRERLKELAEAFVQQANRLGFVEEDITGAIQRVLEERNP